MLSFSKKISNHVGDIWVGFFITMNANIVLSTIFVQCYHRLNKDIWLKKL